MVLFNTKMGQPALLYLCPCTLASTIIFAYVWGGTVELNRLWTTKLPLEPVSSPPTEKKHLSENNGELPNYSIDSDTVIMSSAPTLKDGYVLT